MYIYICNHENNVPSRLSPQWLCGNSCTWAHDVRFHIAGTNEPKSAQQAYYAHLASVSWITYDHLYYAIYILYTDKKEAKKNTNLRSNLLQCLICC